MVLKDTAISKICITNTHHFLLFWPSPFSKSQEFEQHGSASSPTNICVRQWNQDKQKTQPKVLLPGTPINLFGGFVVSYLYRKVNLLVQQGWMQKTVRLRSNAQQWRNTEYNAMWTLWWNCQDLQNIEVSQEKTSWTQLPQISLLYCLLKSAHSGSAPCFRYGSVQV